MAVKGDSADAIAAAVPMKFAGLTRKPLSGKKSTPKRKEKEVPQPTTPKRHTASTAKSPRGTGTPRSSRTPKPRTPKREFENFETTTPKRHNSSDDIIEAFSTPKQDSAKKEKMFASPVCDILIIMTNTPIHKVLPD